MQPVVKTLAGQVRGHSADGVASFLGILYAAAPFGPNRFRAPQPVPPWEGVREATAHGPTAPAPGYSPPLSELLPVVRVPGDEILNVAVWAPEHGGGGLPVMVWIHGGAFVNGSNSIPVYDGSAFARDGVVVVGVNYRLGAEGFLLTPGGVPNRGLLDQVAALEWVRDNIAAFGGDPGNVTVFGESAGAAGIGVLLAMPAAAGLFRRAVLQSGSGHLTLSPQTAHLVAAEVAAEVGVAATEEALARVPPARLVEAQRSLSRQIVTQPDPARWREITLNGMIYEPVVDGEVVPRSPAGAPAPGVDLLIGSNRHEYRLYAVPSGVGDQIDDAVLGQVAAAYGLPAAAVDTYRAQHASEPPGMVLAEVLTDWFFRVPGLRLAEANSGAFVYEFDWAGPLYDGRLGACHALELGFVFDTLDAARGLTGGDGSPPLAAAMHAAWVSFARTGDPGWEPYGDTRAVRRFAEQVTTEHDTRGATRELWTGIR